MMIVGLDAHSKTCFSVVKDYGYQVGAKMGKTTRPVFWGRAVKTGFTKVNLDILE